ncbi:MAG: hypothetical protein NW206_00995 [Hyphomonadaceae bacterium]|nr:hypothetical protein [Hyphomonadaceae bacterium]
MKPGSKLKSAVCDTEIMVIKGSGDIPLECGGAPMVEAAPATKGAINPDFAEGTGIGKRYVDASEAIELLCVKAGQGSLSIGGVKMQIKGAKPLPASD